MAEETKIIRIIVDSSKAVDTLALRCPTKTRSEISWPSDRSTSSSAPSRTATLSDEEPE